MKTCCQCGSSKPADAFRRAKYAKSGLTGVCKGCLNAKAKASYQRNPDPVRAANRRWSAENRVWYRARARRESINLRLAAISIYSGGTNACACCGETEYEFLAIDHIAGGGRRHKAAIGKRGNGFIRWLARRSFPSGYRVLCHNCNCARGFYGFCPHEVKGQARREVERQ